jgi:CysZ protein
MLAAFLLALGQLTDPRVLRILAKSLAVTLALLALLGWAGWWALRLVLERAGAGELGQLLAAGGAVLLGWLLWRILAIAVMQFFADEVVEAVEAKHYPAALANARKLPWREELAHGLKGAGRALGYNLLALPVALVLLVTGIGPALVFWLVNAMLLGRELTGMVWVRHRHAASIEAPLSGLERLLLGGLVTVWLTVPVANLLAPLAGAAMAAHLVHRKGVIAHAA